MPCAEGHCDDGCLLFLDVHSGRPFRPQWAGCRTVPFFVGGHIGPQLCTSLYPVVQVDTGQWLFPMAGIDEHLTRTESEVPTARTEAGSSVSCIAVR